MNNLNLLKIILSNETVFVLGLTLFGYCSVLSYEAGFISYYKIYIGFIDIGIINIFENIMLRIFPPAVVAYLYASYGNEHISERICKLLGCIISLVLMGYLVDKFYFVYLSFFATLFMFFLFLFRLIKSSNPKNIFFIMMLFLFLICGVFYLYGYYSALTKKEFNSFILDNKKYVILRIYNNSIIANEIINDTYSEHILYIPSNKVEIIDLFPLQKLEINSY